jgi:tellurite resistance protein
MNTQASAHPPRSITRVIALLEYLAPAWFAMVMGWCGLSQAWLRATDVFGDAALGLGLAAAIFAQVVFVLLCLACIVRLHAHPNAVAADMRHPVRHAFMGTLPVSILLLASLGINLFWGTHRTLDTALTFLWCMGSILEMAATVWVVGRWIKSVENGGMQWATLTPVFFIPVVGNVLAPLGGVSIGLEAWATAQFGIGVFLWVVLQTLMFVRVAQAGPLPERMAPTWFITMVPPSLGGLSLLQLDAPLTLVWMMWGIGVFFLCLSLTQVHIIREQGFSMAKWGMSFPMASFTSLTLRMSDAPGGAWLQVPAILLLASTSLLILGLTLNTWRGLRHGHLLVAEK